MVAGEAPPIKLSLADEVIEEHRFITLRWWIT
jgi:hypothetical protein